MVQLSKNTLTDFVRQVVSRYQIDCERKQIDVVFDLEEVPTTFDTKLVHHAISAMVENAIDSMPMGGEVEVTLVNAEFQWELEVADSGASAGDSETVAKEDSRLPRVLSVPGNSHLKKLAQLSVLMNGAVQSWNCPLGGTAHVLIVPKMAASGSLNQRRAA